VLAGWPMKEECGLERGVIRWDAGGGLPLPKLAWVDEADLW
jgi:hypothetical protein